MGAVMSYALGLGEDRPVPAGILAFSGFIPVVEGWAPARAGRETLRAFIAHGRSDLIMEVGFARRARALLEGWGLDVEYHESDGAHHIDPPTSPARPVGSPRLCRSRRQRRAERPQMRSGRNDLPPAA